MMSGLKLLRVLEWMHWEVRQETLKKSWAKKDVNGSKADSLHVRCCGELFSSSFCGAFELITLLVCRVLVFGSQGTFPLSLLKSVRFRSLR